MNTVLKYILWVLAGLGLAGILYYVITYIISIV